MVFKINPWATGDLSCAPSMASIFDGASPLWGYQLPTISLRQGCPPSSGFPVGGTRTSSGTSSRTSLHDKTKSNKLSRYNSVNDADIWKEGYSSYLALRQYGSITFGVGILILQIGSIEFMTSSVLLFHTLQNQKIQDTIKFDNLF